jgi:hypothetical protein
VPHLACIGMSCNTHTRAHDPLSPLSIPVAPFSFLHGSVNLFGVIHGVKAFLPAMMAANDPGVIICTGSKQGITMPPGNLVIPCLVFHLVIPLHLQTQKNVVGLQRLESSRQGFRRGSPAHAARGFWVQPHGPPLRPRRRPLLARGQKQAGGCSRSSARRSPGERRDRVRRCRRGAPGKGTF